MILEPLVRPLSHVDPNIPTPTAHGNGYMTAHHFYLQLMNFNGSWHQLHRRMREAWNGQKNHSDASYHCNYNKVMMQKWLQLQVAYPLWWRFRSVGSLSKWLSYCERLHKQEQRNEVRKGIKIYTLVCRETGLCRLERESLRNIQYNF